MKKEFGHEERNPLSANKLLKLIKKAEELGFSYIYEHIILKEEVCLEVIEKGYSIYLIINFYEEDSYTCIPLRKEEKKGEIIVIKEFLIEEMINIIEENDIDQLYELEEQEDEEE